ncbi:transmembrane protein, putative (macronuclear) [Tetrahymena thermophila SB210]|uniref:Transmembrane protein, putative n=1 Tax=Tetrahymena thermophila (strain SB210) TaxID=312017 RepID=W7XF83_TETTS|nr:transmembrane protein, putative [Tetrahymena thermophila SB210]EWS76462.1 transmembrane protein, putative [Tetrahymena thermophila SB210]|eukprot:XP_012651004.1 transmembrane protein, putative [Tetrahymena thermophila SB210]
MQKFSQYLQPFNSFQLLFNLFKIRQTQLVNFQLLTFFRVLLSYLHLSLQPQIIKKQTYFIHYLFCYSKSKTFYHIYKAYKTLAKIKIITKSKIRMKLKTNKMVNLVMPSLLSLTAFQSLFVQAWQMIKIQKQYQLQD